MTQHAKKSGGRGATIFMLCFGLPFLAGGLFACWLVFSLLAEAYAARHWVETPAVIRSVDLERHSGDDSTTYKVVCRYTYHVNDHQYEGTRVGLMDMSDNIGSWHQDTYNRLHRAYQREEPVICYVDPSDPATAVLDRELRFAWLAFMLVFATVFTSVGGGFMLGGFYARRAGREKATLIAEHPSEPWLHRPDWAGGVLSPHLGRAEAILWLFAIFWNLVSSPILFVLPAEITQKRNYLALVGLIFPLAGWILLIVAFRATARRRKFQGSQLRLATVPGVIGGRLRGVLTLAGRIEGMDQVHIELRCVHTYSTGSGKQRQTHTNTLWSEGLTRDVALTFGQTSTDIPLDFQIPYDCRPTDETRSDDNIKWKLEARAGMPGVDLALDFEVPVFRTPASDPGVGPAPEKMTQEEEVIASADCPLPDKIRGSLDVNGNPEFTLSAWPGMTFFIVFAAVDLILTGVAVFSVIQIARGNWFMLIFLLVFGAISLLFTLMLLSLFGRYRITLLPGGLRSERFWGPFRRTREAAASEIESVQVHTCASAGDRKYYALYCKTGQTRRLTLATNIPGDLPARWLARRIEEHLSRPGSPAMHQSLRMLNANRVRADHD